MVVLDNATVYDVVFMVEGTANLGAYFDTLKANYILPTLENFNGGPEEVEYGCDYNCSLYSLVIFYGADCVPGPTSRCVPPTTSIKEFVASLDKIDFAGGNGETNSHMSEGFATALQLFDDLEKLREPNVTTQKHCILVCNSMPFQLTSQESINYANFTTDQLIAKLPDKSVHFSMISPRKIPVLFRLFDKASGDLPQTSMQNYATDSRHLILLNGYQLPVRPSSPGVTKKEMSLDLNKGPMPQGGATKQTPSPAGPAPVPIGGATPRLPGPGPSPGKIQQASGPIPMDTSNPNPGAKEVAQEILASAGRGRGKMPPISGATNISQVGGPGPNVSIQTPTTNIQDALNRRNMMIRAQSLANPQASNQPGMMTSQGMVSSHQGTPASQQTGIMTSQQQPMMNTFQNVGGLNQQQQQQQQQQPQQGQFVQPPQMNQMRAPQPNMQPQGPNISVSNPQMNNPPGNIGGNMPNPNNPNNPTLGVDMNNPAPTLERNAQQQQRNIIWSGALEWQDKAKNTESTRPTRTLPCHVSAMGPDAETLNATKWPAKLVMQLIPQTLLQPLQPLFKNSRTVNFQFAQSQDRESLVSLYKVMANGFAGCVHFPSVCEVRVLMLLYSNRKKQFMGLIPNDQAKFVNGIRAVITKHKQVTQQGKMQQMGQPGAAPGQQPNPAQPQFAAGQNPMAGATQPQQGFNFPGISPGLPPPPSHHMHYASIESMNPNMGQNMGQFAQAQGGQPMMNNPNPQQGAGALPVSMGGNQQMGLNSQGPMTSSAATIQGQSSNPSASTPGQITSHGGLSGGQVQQNQGGQGGQASQGGQGEPTNMAELRLQNQRKIANLQQTLEAAKQQELAFQKAEQQKRILQQQQQQQLAQQQTQQPQQIRLPFQQQPQQQPQPGMLQPSAGSTNQQLRHLLLNQQREQQMRNQQQQQQQQQLQQMQMRMRGPAPQQPGAQGPLMGQQGSMQGGLQGTMGPGPGPNQPFLADDFDINSMI